MPNVTRQLRRILDNILQIGGLTGFQLKNSSAIMQVRNAADSGFADAELAHLLLHGANATFKATVTVPTLSGDINITLPLLPGGGIGFSGMHVSKIVSFNQASGATFNIDTAPPPNATLNYVRVAVDTAAGASNPTLAIGITGTTAKYQATTDNNLKEVGQFVSDPFEALGGTPSAIIGTLSAASQTFAGRIEIGYILA